MVDPALHFGAYRGTPDALELVATGQRLTLERRRGDFLHFIYEDREIDLHFRVRERVYVYAKSGAPSASLIMGFGPENASAAMREYGLWRRVSWFLLEALLVRLAIQHEGQDFSQLEVRIDGGWLSSGWTDRVRLSVHAFNLYENARLVGPQPSEMLTSRDRQVPSACLFPGSAPTAELTREMAVSAGSKAIVGALKRVPRYELSDGTVLFFSKVNPHSGPEYTPNLTIGMLYEDILVCTGRLHGSYQNEPVSFEDDAAILVRSAEAKGFGVNRTAIPETTPLASLHEHEFYARLAAAEVSNPSEFLSYPEMAHPVYPDQKTRFYIAEASCGSLPYAIGLGNGPRGTILNTGIQDNPDA